MEAFGYSDWRKHEGGPNPHPDGLVDLIWGIGLIERQPADRVNWSFHWTWRQSDHIDNPRPIPQRSQA